MATKIKLVPEGPKPPSNEPPDDLVINTAELRKDVGELEELDADIADIRAEKKDKLLALRGKGYDTKAILALIRLRRMDQEKRKEEEAVLDLYKQALDMD